MNYRSRRRSLSRDSFRRYSSEDRSASRSRSPRRYRRSSSRGRRSYSKSRRYLGRDDRSYSRSASSEHRHRDRRRHSSPSPDHSDLNRKSGTEPEGENSKTAPRRRTRNMAWKLPNLNDSNSRPPNFGGQRNNTGRRQRFVSRFHPAAVRNNLGNYRYESEEFKSQKVLKEKETAHKENNKLLSEYTTELNTLVGNLSSLAKDSDEYRESNEKIQELKKAMKELINENLKPKPPAKTPFQANTLDNRETKVVFPSLPECAKGRRATRAGKGNLAKWISDNAKILLPKEIAMLASHGNADEGAVIEYKTHATAQKVGAAQPQVLNSCKLHGISVAWHAPSEPEPPKAFDVETTNNSAPEVVAT